MIPRYESAELAAIFSDRRRMQLWRDVELAVVRAMADAGELKSSEVAPLFAHEVEIDDDFVARVLAREAVTNHDLAAFVDVLQADYDTPAARFIHFGLTSSDIVDTALSLQIVAAMELLLDGVDHLLATLRSQSLRYRRTAMLGRTHGMAAEPTTFGAKLALWTLALDRERTRLVRAREQIAVGKLSGAVGTYSNIAPALEATALSSLGLDPAPATQVIGRDRHAEVIMALASTAAMIESCALEIRHLARSEVMEVQEPFAPGQKGSSAMPHKRNPILSERLCGMARLARGFVVPALEDISLWHERDISHSSVERMMVPDAFQLVFYMVTRFDRLVADLVVHEESMARNLANTHGLIYSQSLLLAMVRTGLDRDEAYRIVQEATTRVLAGEGELGDLLTKDERCPLPALMIEELTSIDRLLANLDPLFARLATLEGSRWNSNL